MGCSYRQICAVEDQFVATVGCAALSVRADWRGKIMAALMGRDVAQLAQFWRSPAYLLPALGIFKKIACRSAMLMPANFSKRDGCTARVAQESATSLREGKRLFHFAPFVVGKPPSSVFYSLRRQFNPMSNAPIVLWPLGVRHGGPNDPGHSLSSACHPPNRRTISIPFLRCAHRTCAK